MAIKMITSATTRTLMMMNIKKMAMMAKKKTTKKTTKKTKTKTKTTMLVTINRLKR
jgi:hypothetical protein